MTQEVVVAGDRVAWLDMAERGADVVYATTLPDGPPLVLQGSAGLIFAIAADGGTVEDVVTLVSEAAEVEPAEIRDTVVAFVDQLVSLGLLVRR
jgi:hypothetical protein